MYNEAPTVRAIVEKVRSVAIEKEIIIVNDASTDGSGAVIDELGKEHTDVCIVHQQQNRGKGAAIRTGLEHVTGDVVIVQDADLELDPHDYPALVKPIIEGTATVVYGSRELGTTNKHLYVSFYLGGKLVSLITNLLFGTHLTDVPVGYKVVRTEVMKSLNLQCERFDFDPEITGKILGRGIKIIEVPVSYYPRTQEEGKKIGWRDGVQAVWTLLKCRFT